MNFPVLMGPESSFKGRKDPSDNRSNRVLSRYKKCRGSQYENNWISVSARKKMRINK
jgi:hypothetical protein